MSANKKRKVIDVDWIEERIFSQIPKEIAERPGTLSDAIKEWRLHKEVFPSVTYKR